MQLSVVIVNYYSKELPHCLKTLKNSVPLESEIFIVNNSPEKLNFEGVTIIQNNKNIGYAKACNKGIDAAKGRYILILNPDVIVGESTIKSSIRFMDENSEVNICGIKLLEENGSVQESARNFPKFLELVSRRLFKNNTLQTTNHKLPTKVEWVSGAFMLMRGKHYFDEKFFMYFEDVDLCRTVGNVWYCPYARAMHKTGYGSKKNLRLFLEHVKSMMYYFLKWH
ncbi:glycosyltransferase family 2 protein [Candidatus Woesearchaeota archaeon]|nr:glycosyltransferase family 2 protein [Candidatus Woesearchaeota archaeon]